MEEPKIPRAVREALIENESVAQRFKFSGSKVYLTNGRLLCKRGGEVFPLRYSGITSTRKDYERSWKSVKWGTILIAVGIAVIVLVGRMEGAFALFLGSLLLLVGLMKRNYLTIFQALPYGMPVKPLQGAGVMAKGRDEDRVTSITLKASKKRVDDFLESFNQLIGSGRVGQGNCLTVGMNPETGVQEGRVGIVEASMVKGEGKMIATGLMERIMEESTKAAITYARAKTEKYGIDENFAVTNDIHVHAPEAVRKDGPSAGISISCALISALTNKPIARDVAMTGEITIKGDVLPIGGVEEKVLGAYEAGIKDMIVPLDNQSAVMEFLNINRWIRKREKELKEICKSEDVEPETIALYQARIENFKEKRKLIKSIKKKKLINFHYVEKLEQAVKIALPEVG